MKLKTFALALVATTALMALAASAASATTLEVEGKAKNQAVEIKASLKPSTSTLFKTTEGAFVNTCTSSSKLDWRTSGSFTGTNLTGPVVGLILWPCTSESIVVDNAGQISIEHIPGTTNGTVVWENAQITFPSPVGQANCKTGAGTDIGTLKGAASGHAALEVKAVMSCGFFLPSTVWEGSYVITSPTGLGVVA